MKAVTIRLLLLVLAAGLVISGCQGGKSLRYKPKPSEAQPVATALPPSGLYLDFEDVQVPRTLQLNRQKSYVYRNENIQTGVLIFSSSRPAVEIADYFVKNMPKDNWNLQARFKFHKSILFFTKATKNCLIIIQNPADDSSPEVEVWVSPVGAGDTASSYMPGHDKKR